MPTYNLGCLVRSDAVPAPADLRCAFLLVTAIGLASALRFLRLAPDAGAEVSGHRRWTP